MKKLINSPETVVTEALQGIAAAHPSLSVDIENKVITEPTQCLISAPGHLPLLRQTSYLLSHFAARAMTKVRSCLPGFHIVGCR